MSKNNQDTYLYPNSLVLINKFDIKDSQHLQEVEAFIFASKPFSQIPVGKFDYEHLKAIHYYYFSEVYHWAGLERTIDIAKGDSYFAHIGFITPELNKIFVHLKKENYLKNLSKIQFSERLAYYFNEINAAHPFREGNGRTLRAFCDLLAANAGYVLNWQHINKAEYLEANIIGFINGNHEKIKNIFEKIAEPINILSYTN